MKKTILLFLSFFLVLSSCTNNSEEFQTINPNLKFKLISFSDSNAKIGAGSFVQFAWTIKNENEDTIYQDRLFIQLDKVIPELGIQASICLLKQGEKGAFVFPISQLEKSFLQKTTVNPNALEGIKLTHFISIDKVFTETEFLTKKQEFLDWINTIEPVNFNSIEQQVIENYIQNNQLTMKTSETGLHYRVYNTNSGIKTGYGKHVKISYNGGSLSQDKKHISTTQDFYIGEEMQVIKAIEEVILHMEQGDSAVVIAPSNLAFGSKGSSTGIIPASTPVFYRIKLVSCE